MRDVGSGSVVVRLFNGGVPCFVKIAKSVVSGLGAHSFVWVKLFEKAAAALQGTSYANPGKGGVNADKAFGMLLGVQATAIMNNAAVDDPDFLNTSGKPCLMTCFASSNPNFKANIEDTVFFGDNTLFNGWINWWTQDRCSNWLSGDYNSSQYEHFEEYLTKNELDAGTRDQVLLWATKNSILPGKRSSGVYSRRQLHAFNDIRNLCLPQGDPSKREPIVAETKPFSNAIMGKNPARPEKA